MNANIYVMVIVAYSLTVSAAINHHDERNDLTVVKQ